SCGEVTEGSPHPNTSLIKIYEFFLSRNFQIPNSPTVCAVSTGLYHCFLAPIIDRIFQPPLFGSSSIVFRSKSVLEVKSCLSSAENASIAPTCSFNPRKLFVTLYQNPQSPAKSLATYFAFILFFSSVIEISCARISSIMSVTSFMPGKTICTFSRRRSVGVTVGESYSRRFLKSIG